MFELLATVTPPDYSALVSGALTDLGLNATVGIAIVVLLLGITIPIAVVKRMGRKAGKAVG